MTIGAISFQPYVYNVNSISPASMNRLSRISDDVLDKKIDYSGLTEAENENPLKKGQTLDFQGILDMQMQRGRSNAARIMKPAQAAVQDEAGDVQTAGQAGAGNVQAGAVQVSEAERAGAWQQAGRTEAVPGSGRPEAAVPANTENGSAGSGISNFRMQQAMDAYAMSMTA